MDYNFSEIEPRWSKYWRENETYAVSNQSDKPKYYILDMFPYPSGSGLHVGHPLGYIASDIYARYKRMKGFNVLHPMGFDAFGLPAEQYAMQTGKHPADSTAENIETYKSQLSKLGFNYDPKREVVTCDPKYYRWTQWIFLQMFDHWFDAGAQKARPISELINHFKKNGYAGIRAAAGQVYEFTAAQWRQMPEAEKRNVLMQHRLAYQSHADVWYCSALGTVLANDEVKDGVSERGGHPVERRSLRQWFLRVTAYAERLINDLNNLEWSDAMKEMQRNWIGRSEGASMWFDIDGHAGKNFEIFTTRPDTIFGVTFMVLAPEHELVQQITTAAQKPEIEQYLEYVNRRSERDRIADVKTVTGAFTGAYAIHPFTGNKVPIWISEYVLASYGTGAIMAVPSDDDRDNAFAEKFGIEIIDIIDKSDYPNATRDDKVGKMINSDFINGMEVPDAIRAIIDDLEARKIGKGMINYRLRDANFSRQRYWGEPYPIIYKNDVPYALPESELPLLLPEWKEYKGDTGGESPLATITEWVNTPEGKRETDTMPGFAGSSWYFLRYMDPTNEEEFVSKEAVSYWQNVDFYIGGTEHAVGHLIYSRMWHKFLYDTGRVGTVEPFKKLVNQGMIQGRSSFVYRIKGTNTFVSRGLRDQYEITELHVDVNIVQNDILDTDAFKKWRPDYATAEFILEDGKYYCGFETEKMSKSYYNVVNPDVMVEKYGADCFRMFEMFLGPLQQSKPWNTDGISGVSRFFNKLWTLFNIGKNGQPQLSDAAPEERELKILHKTIKKVNQDVERLSFNTCVSGFMECVNQLGSKCNKREILLPLVRLIAPFAPFVSEELWHLCGGEGSVHHAAYPDFEQRYVTESSKEYPIQVNGKVRAKLTFDLAMPKDEIEAAVLANPAIQKWTEGKTVRKFVYVPGRIISVVAK